MMNGKDDMLENDQNILDTIIEDMILAVQLNTKDGLITEEGMEELRDLFGEVHPIDREAVFIEFLKELEFNGIEYDINQFKTYDA